MLSLFISFVVFVFRLLFVGVNVDDVIEVVDGIDVIDIIAIDKSTNGERVDT